MNTLYNILKQYRYRWKSALLSSLGIIIAITALIMTSHLTRIATKNIQDNFHSLGSNQLNIMINSTEDITHQDLDASLGSIPHIINYHPMAMSYLNYGDTSFPTIGSTVAAQNILQFEITSGRLLHAHDKQPYAVICQPLIDSQDQTSFALEQQILMEQGVIEPIGITTKYTLPMLYHQPDGIIFVAEDTFSALFPDIKINTLIVEVDDFKNLIPVSENISLALKKTFPGAHITTLNPAKMVKVMESSISMVKLLAYIFVLICSVLGGIGIMNMSLANIASRHTELALRLSFGATIQQIQLLLLYEMVTLCLLSSIIATILSLSMIKAITAICSWPLIIYPSILLYSLLFALIIGILSSLYPTRIIKKIPLAAILKAL